ncbi:MAG: hypothetical protein ABW122_09480, partial [Ilumatobacteraceae bacterium]
MTTTDRTLWRLTAVAAPVLLLASLAYLSSTDAPTIRIAINGIVCGTYLATGLLAWKLRPANRTGRVMVATGLLLMLDPLQAGNVAALVLVGLVATTVSDVLLGYLILAFPWGTLRSDVDRAFVAVSAVAMLSANIAAF